jgi:hypothetical protein
MATQGQFTGKVAFVTGAASGIGRAAALAFAREGASVAVADVSDQGNQETARMIEEQGGQALAVGCDVTRAADVKGLSKRPSKPSDGWMSRSTTPASSPGIRRRRRTTTRRSGTASSTSTSAASSCAHG